MKEGRLIFAAGTGAAGFTSLTALLQLQTRASISLNVELLPWSVDMPACGRVVRRIRERSAAVIGDLSPCWLPYLPLVAAFHDARMVVLQGRREDVVARHIVRPCDHWSLFPDPAHQPTTAWARALPKFAGPGQTAPYTGKTGEISRQEAAEWGWDAYNRLATELLVEWPDNLLILEAERLDWREDQLELLTWLGFTEPRCGPVHPVRPLRSGRWPQEDV